MISRRECFDAREPWVIEPAREYEVTNEIVSPHLHGDERHAHLKGDPSFLRKNLYRTAFLDHRCESVEQLAHFLRFTNEMRFQADVATGMTLVAIGEASTALGTSPQSW
jgi:hypothetical protein